MSQYADYIKEREDFNTIETSYGFITYKIQGDECYARDIYVAPQFRSYKTAYLLIEAVRWAAKAAGCRYLLGTINPETRGAGRSLKLMQYYGFKEIKQVNDLIVLQKEI